MFYILVCGGVDDTMTDQISEWIIGNKSLETLDLSFWNNKLTEKGGRIILEAASETDPVVEAMTKRLHKYNHRNKFLQVIWSIIRSNQ